MNNLTHHLSKSTTALTLLAASFFFQLQAAELVIHWSDNSSNEEGFVVEKRLQSSSTFEAVAQLAADSTNYVDTDVINGESYCYMISAYNVMGQSLSSEKCVAIPNEQVTIPPVSTGTGSADVSFEFINKPTTTELAGKKFYGFKSDYTFNTDYTQDSIDNVNFDVNSGSVSYRDRNYFIFTEQGNEIEKGYASIKYDASNSLAFHLTSNGAEQTARLYMMAGAWTNDAAGILVTAGNKTTRIELPKGYTWHYIAVDISFNASVDVSVSPDSTHGSYSSLMFAGIVLNEKTVEPNAVVESIDLSSGKEIDVSNTKYMTATGFEGNNSAATATMSQINFEGTGKFRTGTYSFVDNNTEVADGYWGMSWDQNNRVSTTLTNQPGETSYASIYFRAGSWGDDVASIKLIVNNVPEIIELPKNRAWFYIKADISFEGKADIIIEPQGQHGGYSQVAFAGITVK